jgi:hypothetical protein
MKRLLAGTLFALLPFALYSETIGFGDVTDSLGPDFFLDEAVVGGGDVDASIINFDRTLGPLIQGNGGSDLMITGLGWACSSAGVTATQVTATITYLGADGLPAGGDDELIGSRTDNFIFSGAGEYVWRFDTPLAAHIDGANSIFRINLSTNGTGNLRYKVVDSNPKLSVAGSSIALAPVNLALYRAPTVAANPAFARYATDGVVGSDFKWIMKEIDQLPQTLEIEFPGPVVIGSYHLYHGVNDANKISAFHLEYFTSSGWQTVPGSSVSSNSDSENNILFAPITVEKVRLTITGNAGDGRARVREWAIFPYNGGIGFPLGTGVTLNMAQDGLTESDSNTAENADLRATDAFLETYWQSEAVGPHTIEVKLRDEIDIKYVHIHSGESSSGTALSDFVVQYSDDNGVTWNTDPAGTITGNSQTDLAVEFSTKVRADAVRLVINDSTQVAIRELQVFPDNGLADYPLFSNTHSGALPKLSFETYSDAYYRIHSAVDNRALKANVVGATLLAANDLDTAQEFNVLLNSESDTFRIFNRESLGCLAIQGASLNSNATVIEASYAGFPSQQWHLRSAGSGQVYIQNAFSGLYLEADGDGVVQRSFAGDLSQRWAINLHRLYPKKGSAGFPELAADMGSSWAYSWTNNDLPALNTARVDFYPMQWGDFNWDPDRYQASRQVPTTVRFPDWYTRGNPFIFLGFNEPDKANQANIAVATAVELWPRLMAGGFPLLSPATAQVNGPWMVDFMAEADAREYRVEYIGMHTYPGPDPDQVIQNLNDLSAAYDDRPVFLTEFGFSDFDNTADWTEIELYRAMLELLRRLELEPNCRRYALFGFQEDDDPDDPYLQPADPNGRARRTNFVDLNGDLTAIGQLYMGWNGELTPSPDQAYVLHNFSFDMRVDNRGHDSTVDAADIRTGGPSAQVVFESITGVNDHYYITSLLDGKRLRKDSPNTVVWADAGYGGNDAQWSWSEVAPVPGISDSGGWYLITNRTGGNLRYTDAQGMHAGSASGAFYHWYMLPAMTPVDTLPPLAPTDVSANPSHKQVILAWTDSRSHDLASYTIKRSTSSGGPFSVIASDVFISEYTDVDLSNDTDYYYVVEAEDRSGNSNAAAEVMATPVAPLADTYANWQISAFDSAPPGTSQLATADPDLDGLINQLEYAFLMNPLEPSANPLAAKNGTSGIELDFAVNRLASDITWDLYAGTDLSNLEVWPTAAYTIVSQQDKGDQSHYTIRPTDQTGAAKFFFIGIE